MKRLLTVAVVLCTVITALGVSLWLGNMEALALKHETERWAVIEDIKGDRMAVEPVSDEVWSQLVHLRQSGGSMWAGGIVRKYDNKWGFRFDPETVTVAEVTAEGLQSTIRMISDDLDYWLGGWAYVGARVVEAHSPS